MNKKMGRPVKYTKPPFRLDVQLESELGKKLVKIREKTGKPLTEIVSKILEASL